MWNYEKRLQFPIHIKNPNPALAAMIISQYGGPDGESSASMRYLSQRYSMPYREVSGLLTDIATEELSHLEMVSVMVHQLTRNLSVDQIKGTPFEAYYVDHTTGIWPQAAGEFRLMRASSSLKAMRLQIWLKIWQQSRKPAQPMTTLSGLRTMQMY